MTLTRKIRPGRRIKSYSAVLLPFLTEDRIDWEGFRTLVNRTYNAGLTPAVNMDTGFVNLLEEHQKAEVLGCVRELSQGRPFVAGAFIEGQPGEALALYRAQIEAIQGHGGTPILFPCTQTKNMSPDQLVELHRQVGAFCPSFFAFELGEMFVPFGRIFDLETVSRLMQIPSLHGMKHSSLERELEWERLALKERERPEFMLFTGNDLAIDMVMYGSDYLLGLSAFHPEAFALRDRLWEKQDPGFYALNDLLQYLGFLAFRPKVPGYKHNAAQFLKLRGLIACPTTHPRGVVRPDSDTAILADILARLDQMVAHLSPRL
ncbi:MAG: dihydrodipicolinate synthase family protein [Verrucomicrobiae bacterium]|nr:dihydrodipicolinate synthase family protein [Verrucomicrobiae bacterium]